MKILYVGNDLSLFEAELADRELKVKQVRNGFGKIGETLGHALVRLLGHPVKGD